MQNYDVCKIFNMNKEWKFYYGEPSYTVSNDHHESYINAQAGGAIGAAGIVFDDNDWEKVDLPHDYLTETEFGENNLISHGYKERKNAWYRKTFVMDESMAASSVKLVFEGISVHSEIYFNGSLMAHSFSAYNEIEIDLTDRIYYGERINTIAVHIDGMSTEGWWYEGAGIYRNVRLYVKPLLHIAHNGIWIKPVLRNNSENDWDAVIEITAENSGYDDEKYALYIAICDGGSIICEKTSEMLSCLSDGKKVSSMSLEVKNPIRWDVDNPKLYAVTVKLLYNGSVVETETINFGFRTFGLDDENRLCLNGRRIFLNGTCNHQDHAGVGVAVPDSMQYYRMRRLKELGSNAYRCAHNPPSKAILDAADKYGMLVMDENRRFESTPEVLSDLENMVRRDRNHPSVVLYSLFNEESLQNTDEGAAIFRRMKSRVLKLDDTRLITGAVNDRIRKTGAAHEMDIMGVNYCTKYIPEMHMQYPDIALFGSENNSATTTRGCFCTDMHKKQELSEYDEEAVAWGLNVRDGRKFFKDNEYMSGMFVWTGFDYRGEPTPFKWPSCSSQFGIMDLCGFAKEAFYFHKACFTDEPMIRLFPHWNWNKGDIVRVMTVTNCDEAELFLNGKSLGRKKSDVFTQCEWKVPFEAGVILAKAYKNGVEAAFDERKTTSKPEKIVLEPDRKYIFDDGEDTVPIKVYTVDKDGVYVPTADNMINFEVTSGGKILGVGNGNPNSHEPDNASYRRLFSGLCQLIVKSEENADKITVYAYGEGLEGTKFSFDVRHTQRLECIYMTENRSLNAFTANPVPFVTRPDPLMYIADNDMNTLSPIDVSVRVFSEDFSQGWRLYRAFFETGTKPKSALNNKCTVKFKLGRVQCSSMEVYLDGELICSSASIPAITFEFEHNLEYGKKCELRFLLKAYTEEKNGVKKGCVSGIINGVTVMAVPCKQDLPDKAE